MSADLATRVSLLVVSMALVVLVLSCGVSANENSRMSRHQLTTEGNNQTPCTSATAVRSGDSRFIEVVATCAAKSIGLIIQGAASHHRPVLPLISYHKALDVDYHGRVYRSGKCTLRVGELGCQTTLKGPSEIRERFQVRKRHACGEIYISETGSAPECREQNCNAAFAIHPLFKGRPRGC
jgi:hypothetical protein